jgi:pimeloyl-ACP methyl ester carboxylesterase
MRSPLGRMTTQWNLFPYFMWLGVHKRSQFRSRALPYYLSPFKSGSRRGIRTLAGALTLETDWLETVETRAQRTLSESPALILWGMRDPVLSPTLIKRWEDVLPDVETRRIDDAGHFVPEDVDNDYNDLIETFLG